MHGVVVQQPARWQVVIASGEAKSFRKAVYAEAASGAEDVMISSRRGNISASIPNAAARAVSSSTTRLASPGATSGLCQTGAGYFQFLRRAECRHHPHRRAARDLRAIDCGAYVGNFMLAAQALGLGTIPQAALARHSGIDPPSFSAWA